MRVAAAQMDIAWHNRGANYAKARSMAHAAAKEGAALIVLPEMFATGFSMDTAVTAEKADGPTPSFLRTLARETGLHVVAGFVLAQPADRPWNVSLAVAPDGSDLALYKKIHQIGILEEDRHYAPGPDPLPFGLPALDAACLVCYDLRFPELFRAVASRCGLFMVIASWPAVRQNHWDILLPARAVENQAFMVGVNRVGEGGGHSYLGGSAIVAPTGEILARAGSEETLLLAEVDPATVGDVRQKNPFLKDRKPLDVQAGWEKAADGTPAETCRHRPAGTSVD